MSDPILHKRRRLPNSCDRCKLRKVKCDSVNMPNGICSNCVAARQHCVHTTGFAISRPPAEKLQPADDTLEQRAREVMLGNAPARTLAASLLSPSAVPSTNPIQTHTNLLVLAKYIHALEKVVLDPETPEDRASNADASSATTHSPSSQIMPLIQADAQRTADVTDQLQSMTLRYNMDRWQKTSPIATLVGSALGPRETRQVNRGVKHEEDALWMIHPWQTTLEDHFQEMVPLDFPPADLMLDLVQLYFLRFNVFHPILHRPTFQRLMEGGLQERDYAFGCTVLAVCALGSRHSSDPRVLVEGCALEYSCGWKWFNQIRIPRRRHTDRVVSIYELQLYPLMSFYMNGASLAPDVWVHASAGLRLAQESQFYSQKPPGPPSSEKEHWTRAFWALIAIDIFISASIGRVRASTREDLEQDLPIECDDEYWDHQDPQQSFRQPKGTASLLSGWVHTLKLLKTFSLAQQAMHSIQISNDWSDVNPQDLSDKIIRRLDSSLNEWVDSMPEHLVWDPNRKDDTFFSQSVLSYCTYYHVQIMIHKFFITLSPVATPLDKAAFPSLAICANAARSCAKIIQVQERHGPLALPSVFSSIFHSAAILLLNLWASSRAGKTANHAKELEDVHAVINILRSYKSWQSAGRLSSMLEELLTAGKNQLGSASRVPKRARQDFDTLVSGLRPSETNIGSHAEGVNSGFETSDFSFRFPLHSKELGNLPIYESMGSDFSGLTNMSTSERIPPQNQDGTPHITQPDRALDGSQSLYSNHREHPIDELHPAWNFSTALPPVSQERYPMPSMSYSHQVSTQSSSYFGVVGTPADPEIPWDSWTAYMSGVEMMMQNQFNA